MQVCCKCIALPTLWNITCEAGRLGLHMQPEARKRSCQRPENRKQTASAVANKYVANTLSSKELDTDGKQSCLAA